MYDTPDARHPAKCQASNESDEFNREEVCLQTFAADYRRAGLLLAVLRSLHGREREIGSNLSEPEPSPLVPAGTAPVLTSPRCRGQAYSALDIVVKSSLCEFYLPECPLG